MSAGRDGGWSSLIGTFLDKYEVLQKVGEGGMATVYRGRHTTLDRDVAIKVLHPHLSSSTRNRKRFAREARAIEHLRHDNILEIFDYSGIDSSDCYIITEFVQGKTLTELTDDSGSLPSEIVAQIGIRLCEALEYAHTAGILHRDLKPENVMVRFDGRVKLMDFGIARFLDESQVTLTGALIGSPAFMSPEQAREDDLDPRSDLFSLGTVLFYLVTGGLPFTGSNPSLILKKVIEGDRPGVSDLCPSMSATLADAIERLLSTDPNGRFNTAQEASRALLESLDEVGIDPEDERWHVTAFLRDPEGYRRDLELYIPGQLLQRGRQFLDEGESLQALRLFNRLLSIDESNEEVLELIQTLHVEPASEARQAVPLWLPALLLPLVLLGGMAAWWMWQPPGQPAVPQPVEPAPAPSPEPSPRPDRPPEPAPSEPTAPSPEAPPVQPEPRPTALVPSPTPLAPSPGSPATLRIQSNLLGEVFHEGRRLGTTRGPIELQPGSYELEIRGDVVLPRTLRVEVGPGDDVTERIQLQARPATVLLADRFSDDCRAILDGADQGTVAQLGRKLQVHNPDRHGHRLEVVCDDQPPFVHVWNSVVFPGDRIGSRR